VDVPARVAVLEGGSIAPGKDALVQLVLGREIGALRGDRLIVRDQSAWRTLAGGEVIDPFAPARGRAKPERISLIRVMEKETVGLALEALMEAMPGGVDLKWFAQTWNLAPADASALWEKDVPIKIGDGFGLTDKHWQSWREKTRNALSKYHGDNKDAQGVAQETLRRMVGRVLPKMVFAQLISELARAGALSVSGGTVRLSDHRVQLAPQDVALWKKLGPAFEASDLRPPSLGDLADEGATDVRSVERFLNRAARLGLVVQISAKRFLLPDALERLGAMAEAIAEEDSTLTIKALRDKSGIGRNVTIEVAEFFDRVGFTRRSGNERDIRKPAVEVDWVRRN
jgi:selenocysteine-specific elongation factor